MQPPSAKVPAAVFLVIGLALVGAGAAWYYYDVERPLAWPMATATVVSSRVVNPTNPNQHSPELVLRLEDGEARDVTLTASWSSGSYDMVKRYVDRYPPGLNLEVAVNPARRNDVRYELGATFTNLLGPIIVGSMGVLFAGVGAFFLLRAGRQSEMSQPAAKRLFVWVFGSVGVIVLAIGGWLLSADVNMLRTWPEVDAVSTAARGVSTRSSVGNRPSQVLYDVQVTFKYTVDGREFQSQTTSGMSSSSLSRRDELLQMFAPGTSHRIRHRPDDPNVIRYNLKWSIGAFALSGGLVLMGLVFLAFAAVVSRF